MPKVVVELPITNERRFNAALVALRNGSAAEALREAKELIDAGYPHAYTLAAAICERGGRDLEKNPREALFYYQKAVDEARSLEAWLALGRMYYFGKGVDPDHQKALYYYSTVYEETKNGIAAMMLARLYYEGKGVQLDRDRALSYLTGAIEDGFAFAPTQLAQIERSEGRYVKAIVHWLQGIWRALRLPKGDTRLRPY